MNDPRSDSELVRAVNDGDERAFDALYYRHRDWVVRLAWRFTGNETDALDVLQETFAYFSRKFPGFVLSANLTTFFYPVVRNLALAQRRKRLRHAPGGGEGSADALAELPAPPVDDPPDSQRTELAAALRSLPDDQREAVLMRFVDEMSLLEIAAALEVPVGTVKSRLHRALEALRNDPAMREYFS